MKPNRILVALVAALACAALLAGCGGPTKDQYEKDVNKIGKQVEKDLDALDSGAPSADDLEKAGKSLDKAADEIDDVDPPSEVKDLHEDLVSTLHDTADLMGKMGPLMEQATKDPASLDEKAMKQMNEIQTEFSDIEKRMKKIEKGYAAKKYDIGLDTGN